MLIITDSDRHKWVHVWLGPRRDTQGWVCQKCGTRITRHWSHDTPNPYGCTVNSLAEITRRDVAENLHG